MTPRRGFLALVGGAGAVTGSVLFRKAAGSSGVVSDIREQTPSCASRPDAELISACREYLGCERIASELRAGAVPSSESSDVTFRAQGKLLSDAVKEQNRLLPQLLKLSAKTHEGLAMKARVISAIFAEKSGLRGAAVRSLTDDIAAIIGRATSMTFRNRFADARLRRIEKALQSAENRLDAAVGRELPSSDNEADNSDTIHTEIRTLVEEASRIHPASAAGLAAKARIVVRNYNLGFSGQALLYSLIEDLQIRERQPI